MKRGRSNGKGRGRKRARRCNGEDLNRQVDGRVVGTNVDTPSGGVRIIFSDIATELCVLVAEAHAVVGAVAWFTDKEVLRCMAERKGGVRLAITNDTVRKDVREAYSQLKRADDTIAGGGGRGAVLRVGERAGKMRALMHHKFLVGIGEKGEYLWCVTGSYNVTSHSRRSMENMVVMRDPAVCEAFHNECKAIFASSACRPL